MLIRKFLPTEGQNKKELVVGPYSYLALHKIGNKFYDLGSLDYYSQMEVSTCRCC